MLRFKKDSLKMRLLALTRLLSVHLSACSKSGAAKFGFNQFGRRI
jgi:hypothetical protein